MAAASRAVALAVSSGCSIPRSPANAQQPQSSGTVAESATADATAIRLAFEPALVLEQVGCTLIAARLAVTVSAGSSRSAAKSTASMMVRPGRAAFSSVCTRPSEHDELSHTIGNSPSRDATQSASTVRSTISAYPTVMPFDFHGVPQHSDPIPSGRTAPTPAFASSDSNDAATPAPPSAGPNMVPTQAWK